jgi:hypothetical protein
MHASMDLLKIPPQDSKSNSSLLDGAPLLQNPNKVASHLKNTCGSVKILARVESTTETNPLTRVDLSPLKLDPKTRVYLQTLSLQAP